MHVVRFWGEQDTGGSWLQLRLVSVLFSRERSKSCNFPGYLYCAQIKDLYYLLITKRTVISSHDQSKRFFQKLKNLKRLKNLGFLLEFMKFKMNTKMLATRFAVYQSSHLRSLSHSVHYGRLNERLHTGSSARLTMPPALQCTPLQRDWLHSWALYQ